ncbi:MAG: GntR family transcriptional regulator [Pseudomonadota bacterium]
MADTKPGITEPGDANDEKSLLRKIKDAIVCQKLAPSQKITEHVITDMFDTTRSVARSMMEQLTAQNFLVSVSPRITRVAPLTVLNIKENFLLRKMLMPNLVVMSIPHMDLDKLHAHNKSMAETRVSPENPEEILNLLKINRKYNLIPVAYLKYELAINWAKLLEDMAMRIYWLYVKQHGQLPFDPNTQDRLYDAIKRGDPDKTRAMITTILEQNEDRILNSIFSNDQFYSHDLVV